jgi:hypothetical protein
MQPRRAGRAGRAGTSRAGRVARWTAAGVAVVAALLVAVAAPAVAAPSGAPRVEPAPAARAPGPATVPGQLFPRDGLFVRAGAPVYPVSPDGPGCVGLPVPRRRHPAARRPPIGVHQRAGRRASDDRVRLGRLREDPPPVRRPRRVDARGSTCSASERCCWSAADCSTCEHDDRCPEHGRVKRSSGVQRCRPWTPALDAGAGRRRGRRGYGWR